MADSEHPYFRLPLSPPAPRKRQELVSVRRKGGGNGTRVVEVVHVRSGAVPGKIAAPPQEAPHDASLRSETWPEKFPARPTAPSSPTEFSERSEPSQPVIHVMPMWEPASANGEATDVESARPPRKLRAARRQPIAAPKIPPADPFDLEDDGANCLRCGYRVESARETRGLMTCAGCG